MDEFQEQQSGEEDCCGYPEMSVAEDAGYAAVRAFTCGHALPATPMEKPDWPGLYTAAIRGKERRVARVPREPERATFRIERAPCSTARCEMPMGWRFSPLLSKPHDPFMNGLDHSIRFDRVIAGL